MIGNQFVVLISLTILINCIISFGPSSCHKKEERSKSERTGLGFRGKRHHPDDDDDTLDKKRIRTELGQDYEDDDDYDHSSDHLLDERVDNFLDDTVHLINQGGHVLSQHLSKFNDPRWKNRGTTSKSGGGGGGSTPGQSSSFGHKLTTNINANATGIWIGYGKAIQKIIDTFIRQSLPRILDASYSTNVSTECTGAILQMLTGLRRQEPWVMRMMDAMGRPIPAGISDGTITDFGSYDQCLGVKGPDQIVGQYCLMKWAPPLPPRPFLLTLFSPKCSISTEQTFNRHLLMTWLGTLTHFTTGSVDTESVSLPLVPGMTFSRLLIYCLVSHTFTWTSITAKLRNLFILMHFNWSSWRSFSFSASCWWWEPRSTFASFTVLPRSSHHLRPNPWTKTPLPPPSVPPSSSNS